jgi:FixJ family two-component response regulator
MTVSRDDLAPATVFVVDDDPAVLASVELLLQAAGLPSRGFPNAEAFLEADVSVERCVLICDIDMPGMSGLELQQRLCDTDVVLPVVILTGKGNVTAAVRAMKSGAVDFLEKPFDADQLLVVICKALKSSDSSWQESSRHNEFCQCFDSLTPREREIFPCIVKGQASKAVAADLGISKRTVEVHRSRIMHKMHAKTVVDLVRVAQALGGSPTAEPV